MRSWSIGRLLPASVWSLLIARIILPILRVIPIVLCLGIAVSRRSLSVWLVRVSPAWTLLFSWVVLSRVVVLLVSIHVAFVRSAISVGLLWMSSMSVVLLPRITLSVLVMSIAIARAIVPVVMAGLLIHVIAVFIISSILRLGVSIALVIGSVVVVVLLLRRISAIVSLHRSLLVLVVISSTGSLV